MKIFLRTENVLVLLALMLASGCHVWNRPNYNEVVADLTVTGAKAVGVATRDQREYVKDRKKNPNFVGLKRSGYGYLLSFNITTQSGEPLAMDMTQALVASLTRKGYNAVPVVVTQNDDQNAAVQKLKASGAERLILLTLNEWKSVTLMNTALHYDVAMKVYDQDGQVLAEKNIQGNDYLGGSAWNPLAHARQAVPRAFKGKIEELLNSPSIANTLQ